MVKNEAAPELHWYDTSRVVAASILAKDEEDAQDKFETILLAMRDWAVKKGLLT